MTPEGWTRYGWEFIDSEWRLRPYMPRIAQRIIGTSLYFYDTTDAARNGSRSGGSGVLVGQPSASSSWVHLYAVTNAHVVEAGGIVARASTRTGEAKIFAKRFDDWQHLGHDEWNPESVDYDDVAVCWLGKAPLGEDQELQWVPRDWFVTEEHLGVVAPQRDPLWRSGPITAGEETCSVARFVGYDGMERNEPVVRFGNLSSAGLVPVWQGPRHREQQSLLVEARSLAGASGAPVFAYRTGTTYGGGGTPVDNAVLLGIGWGHIKHPEDEGAEYAVEMAIPGRPTPGRYNAGMMAVVPAWTIAKLLDHPKVVALRDQREREIVERAESLEGTTAMDEARGEYEQFEDLARKLVNVPKRQLDDQRRREGEG